MDVMPLHFRCLRYFGLFSETESQHWLVKYAWKSFVVDVILIFSILQLAALTVYRDNVNDFTECLFLSMTYLGLCLKLVNLLCRREEIDRLLDEFRAKICQPRDADERDLLERYQKIASIVFYWFMLFAQFDEVTFAISSLTSTFIGDDDVYLPHKTYEIGSKENSAYYWLTYVFQVVSAVIGIFVNVTLDTMITGFLLLTCGQIDVCCHRFISSSNDQLQRSTRECIVHHTVIWRIIRKIESFFMGIFLPLMFLSLITFCTSIYNVSQANVKGVDSLTLFMYLVCLLCELCCYCWFGNELNLKSTAISETIYNSDWTALRASDRKNLFFIMLSCQKEMSISFHGFGTLTMKIFVWVLKTSYGAYNLLKTVDANNN